MSIVHRKPKILFLVTEDWYFCSHRLPIARKAMENGFEIVVATRVNQHAGTIQQEGFRVIPIRMRRRGADLSGAFPTLLELSRIYKIERPDIVHHVAIKPVIFGSITSLFHNVPLTINAINGLGTLFLSESPQIKFFRYTITNLFRFFFNRPNAFLIVQNPYDYDTLSRIASVPSDRIILIPGSGIDLSYFQVMPEPSGVPVVAMVSRMLKSKGAGELVEAAKILRERNVNLRVILAGSSDCDNSNSFSELQLRQWSDSGIVEWPGHIQDVRKVWAEACIAVLPSAYPEGVPKSLLEAAACGRPIVTTDTPGCRDVVQHEKNGLLIPIKDPVALAESILRLLNNPEWSRHMGLVGRKRMEKIFSQEIVAEKTYALYKTLFEVRQNYGKFE